MKITIKILFLFFSVAICFAQVEVKQIDKKNSTAIYVSNISVLEKSINHIDSTENPDLKWIEYIMNDISSKCINDLSGTNWIHKKFEIIDSIGFEKEISLNLWNIGDANEIYWDRQLIGKRGNLNTNNIKPSEPIYQLVKIPFNYLTIGQHELHIKFHNVSTDKNVTYSSIEIGDDRYFIKRQIKTNYVTIIFTVILFGVASFFMLMFFGFKARLSFLLLAVFCLMNALKSYLSPLWVIQSSGVALSTYNDYLCEIFYTIGNHALLAFFIVKFDIRKISYPLAAAIFLSPILIVPFDARISQVVFFILCYMMIFYGLYIKKSGSLFALSAMTLFAAWSLIRYFTFIWQGYFIGVIFFSIVLLFEAVRDIASQIKLKREANLRSTRLENELLKKNIQPHFILNTLTALQEVVEQNPKHAIKLIQALADEFRLFSKVSGEKLIPISEELEICSAHLKIMEYRKDAKFTLTKENITGNELLPPGILHTIIENGITHGFKSKTNGKFLVSKEIKNDCVIYKVSNDGINNKKEFNKRTGIKYIETRLEESFSGKWELVSHPSIDGWIVEIKICDKSRTIK